MDTRWNDVNVGEKQMGTEHILNGQVSQRVDGKGIGVLQVLMNGNTRREVHAEKNGFHFINIVLINA